MPLTFRQRVALSMPSLILRIMLALIFIWAGLGKLLTTIEVSGADAAALANMGIVKPPAAGSTPPPSGTTPKDATPEETDVDAPEEPEDAGAPEEDVNGAPAGQAEQDPSAGAPRAAEARITLASWRQEQQDQDQAASPTNPTRRTPPWQKPNYTADDFPDPVKVRRLWRIALTIHNAANPPPAPDGTATKPAIWIGVLGSGSLPKWQAIAVVVAQLGGGLLLLMGLLTRLAALAIAGVMLGAMWLYEFGPAIQHGDVVLYIIPNRPAFSIDAWRPLLWQFALFMSALALFFAGPGRRSVDQALFGKRAPEDDDAL